MIVIAQIPILWTVITEIKIVWMRKCEWYNIDNVVMQQLLLIRNYIDASNLDIKN